MIKQIASAIKTQSSTSESERQVESDNRAEMNDDIIQAANMPLIKSPICYSINQIEVLQQLGSHTFAAEYESDEFMQKIIGLLKRPESTKIKPPPHTMEREVQVPQLRCQRLRLHGRKISNPQDAKTNHHEITALHAPGARCHVGNHFLCVVAKTASRGSHNRQRMPPMQRVW